MPRRISLISLTAALLAGCAGFPGRGGPPPDTYALAAAPAVPALPSRQNRQILVAEPEALRLLDSDQVVIRTSPASLQYLSGSQWNDRLPRVLQAKLIEAYENSGRVGGVGRSGEGLAIDFQIVPTVRKFEVVAFGEPYADVELSVKLIDDRNGVVRAQRVFTARQPLAGRTNEDYVRALDAAFDAVILELLPWSMGAV